MSDSNYFKSRSKIVEESQKIVDIEKHIRTFVRKQILMQEHKLLREQKEDVLNEQVLRFAVRERIKNFFDMRNLISEAGDVQPTNFDDTTKNLAWMCLRDIYKQLKLGFDTLSKSAEQEAYASYITKAIENGFRLPDFVSTYDQPEGEMDAGQGDAKLADVFGSATGSPPPASNEELGGLQETKQINRG